MNVLVLNCGSSSIKYQLFDMPAETVLAKGLIQRVGEAGSEAVQRTNGTELRVERPVPDHRAGLEVVKELLTREDGGPLRSLAEIGACGHRVVHGGERVTGSVRIDAELQQIVDEYADLAPLHNPPNLTGIRAAIEMLGAIPQVACFDTAFHQSIPKTAYLYGLPYELYERFRIRKYGFHGTSHRYVAGRAAQLLGKPEAETDLITCHLGNGCSMAAVRGGKSVDTTMGLTPLEGLVMGTRTGDFDPAIVFYLLRKGYTGGELDTLCNKKSGLLGIAGQSNDVRDLEEQAGAGSEQARLALDIFAYRVRKYIGAYLAVLNGCDAVVFTGGIGENDARMRERILCDLDALGIVLDPARNDATVGTAGRIQAPESRVALLVIPTNEELAIAQETFRVARGA
ncbi:MAG: acetate kinase [Kiritimatiellae bacterium]|nr:acetate kinase [Kiritimatiellia bacterium]